MAGVNDLVLVHIENKPGFFARIEDVAADVKPGWWQVKLLVLTIPLQVYTWILDEAQINGEPFTMGGTPIRLEKIMSPPAAISSSQAAPQPAPPNAVKDQQGRSKVLSLVDRKKES